MMSQTSDRITRLAPLVGLVLILPALYFVTASVLDAYLGVPILYRPLEVFFQGQRTPEVFNTVTPFLFLGGLTLGVALNLLPLIQVRFDRIDGDPRIRAELRIRYRQLVVVGAGLALLAVMVAYAVVENLVPHP